MAPMMVEHVFNYLDFSPDGVNSKTRQSTDVCLGSMPTLAIAMFAVSCSPKEKTQI